MTTAYDQINTYLQYCLNKSIDYVESVFPAYDDIYERKRLVREVLENKLEDYIEKNDIHCYIGETVWNFIHTRYRGYKKRRNYLRNFKL